MEALALKLLVAVVGAATTWLLAEMSTLYRRRRQASVESSAFERLTDTVYFVVEAVTQTYVDDLKLLGNWNDETRKLALAKAHARVVGLLSRETIDTIRQSRGLSTNEFDVLIQQLIEAAVRQTKQARHNSEVK